MAKRMISPDMKAVIYGCVIAWVIGLGLCALFGGLTEREILSSGLMKPVAYGIGLIGAFAGGMTAAKKTNRRKLLYAFLSGALFLLTLFVVRGILFKSVTQTPVWVPLAVVIGSILGALCGAGNHPRRRK